MRVSTLLLQVATKLASKGVLYVTGEESLQRSRSETVKSPFGRFGCCFRDRAESIKQMVDKAVPKILVIDSIQVMQLSDGICSGSVNQVRETAAYFTRLAKQKGTLFSLGMSQKKVVWRGRKFLNTCRYFHHVG